MRRLRLLAQGSNRVATMLLFIALGLVLIGSSVRYALKASADRSAFNRWRSQLLLLRDGVDISDRCGYPNPPVMAMILEPFAFLPPVGGALSWYFFKVTLALLALWGVFRLIETPEQPFPLWAKGLAVCMSLKPILDDLQHGNVNLLILALVVACITAYRLRRDGLAGLLLGLAVACKLTPLLLVGYFAWKRAWKTLAGFAVGITLFLYPGFVPALRLGMDHNQRQLVSWYGYMVRPYLVEGKVTSKHLNQSLPGVAARLLSHHPSFLTWQDDRYIPLRYDNFLSLSDADVSWLIKFSMAGFVGLVVWRCRTPDDVRQGWGSAAEFAIITLGMLLFSERTWKHHAVTLMLPFGVLCYLLATTQQRTNRIALGLLLLVAFSLTLLPGFSSASNDTDGALAPSLGKFAQIYGAYTACFLLLLGGLLRLLPAPVRVGSTAASGEPTPEVSLA